MIKLKEKSVEEVKVKIFYILSIWVMGYRYAWNRLENQSSKHYTELKNIENRERLSNGQKLFFL